MAAKLTFFDVENNEITPPKLAFGASLTNAVSVTTGALIQASVAGALAIDATNGIAYKAWNTSSTFEVLNSNGGAYGVHQLSLTINIAVTSTDGTGPVIGDYVGIYGTGAWALTVGNISASATSAAGFGSQNAGVITGGTTAGNTTLSQAFNGSTWAFGPNLTVSRRAHGAVGSDNAGLVVGGGPNTSLSSTELFNGTSWTFPTSNLNVSRGSFPACGSQNAAFITGGQNTALTPISTELFNGFSWSLSGNINATKYLHAGAGTLNAGLIAGGLNATVTFNTSEIFNGSTWTYSGNLNTSRMSLAGSGSQNAGMISGGTNGVGTLTSSELFNGSTWALSGNMTTSRQNHSSFGSQNGQMAAASAGAILTAEIHTQSTWRRMSSKAYYSVPIAGILSSAGVVTLQGIVNTSFTFPANTYLVLNRTADFQTAPNASLSVGLAAVLGGGSNWTYNFANSVTVSNVCNGMLVVATGSGATPITGGNIGTFVINKVVSPNSIQVVNAGGASQNPGTGALNIISSVIATSSPSPQDIIVAYSDGLGILNVIRQPKVGFWSQQNR